MGRRCSVCDHDERDAIDQALVSKTAYRLIANHYAVSPSALTRHSQGHLSPALTAVQASREAEGAATVLDRVQNLYDRSMRILDAADAGGKPSLSLAAIRELRGLSELWAKLTGELEERARVTVNLLTSEDWLRVRAILFEELAPYPELSEKLAARLVQLEDRPRPLALGTGR